MARLTLRIFLVAAVLAGSCLATERPDKAVSSQYEDYVLTHPLTACGPVPTALDPNGVYPYVSYCETANRPAPQKYTFSCAGKQIPQSDDLSRHRRKHIHP